ncbi:MAG: NADAR family protein [Anaerolineae bacterium]|nr:NADAR family protein [Anaerolineae bacterium]
MDESVAGLLELKVYQRQACAVFYKTTDVFGGLSNMAGGYPLTVDGIPIRTSEALYQACRYPHRPDIQRDILAQASPIAAKMKSKHAYPLTRPDWEVVRVPIMAWCLRLKLAQHWGRFSELLLATGRLPIVEASFRDRFWGAVAVDAEQLVGANVLGCLLTALRDRLRQGDRDALREVAPPGIPDLCLLGRRVGE